MQERYKDTDLREALKRKYANTPLLPADFMANMEKRLRITGTGRVIQKRIMDLSP